MRREELPVSFKARFEDFSVVFVLDLGQSGVVFVVLVPLPVVATLDKLLLLTALLSVFPLSISL